MSIFATANLRTEILDFRGFDSSRILILSGGILMSIGISLGISSQGILVGIILVGRLGVGCQTPAPVVLSESRETNDPRPSNLRSNKNS